MAELKIARLRALGPGSCKARHLRRSRIANQSQNSHSTTTPMIWPLVIAYQVEVGTSVEKVRTPKLLAHKHPPWNLGYVSRSSPFQSRNGCHFESVVIHRAFACKSTLETGRWVACESEPQTCETATSRSTHFRRLLQRE